MPSVGYLSGVETVQGSMQGSTPTAAGQHHWCVLPAMPENGTLDNINMRLEAADEFDREVKLFLADDSNNILWESGPLNTTGPSEELLSADASAAAIALTSGVRYRLGFTTEGAATTGIVAAVTGENWYTQSGTWPTVNDPLVEGTPGFYGESGFTLFGHLNYTATPTGPDYTQRKGSTWDVTHGLGTITSATLDGNAITINSTGAGTVNLTDDSGIATSGEYDLVLGDGVGTETYTVQLNVFGVVPANNPVLKNGVAQTNLTGVQLRIVAGTSLNGAEYYYTATGTTDASGNLPTIDISDTVAAENDSVLLEVLTAAGDSIIAQETVSII